MNKMKHYYMQIKNVAISLLLLSACSQENDCLPIDDSENLPLRIEVSVEQYTNMGEGVTRARDFGNITNFEDEDQIGLIVLDKDGVILADNNVYTYEEGNWSFDESENDGKKTYYYDKKEATYTYIAYYPYSDDADGVTSLEGLKKIFAPLTEQNRGKLDLLLWESKGKALKSLDIRFKHAYSSISLILNLKINTGGHELYIDADAAENVSWVINNKLYNASSAPDGSNRLIVDCSNEKISLGWSYHYKGHIYRGMTDQVTFNENTRYVFSTMCDGGTYSLNDANYGDFYCMDDEGVGYLIPGGALSLPDGTNCLGIVINDYEPYDELLIKEKPECKHGSIIALKDACTSTLWSLSNESITDWLSSLDDNPYYIEGMFNYGYANTAALKGYNMSDIVKQDEDKKVLPIECINTYSKENTPPENSSGWYFPSADELSYMHVDYLNFQLNKVSGASSIERGYWSSSEVWNDANSVWAIYFEKDGTERIKGEKNFNFCRVRPALAF